VKYVLDTHAVSALMKGETAVGQLLAAHWEDVAIPQPVIAGIERLPRSKRRQKLQERFDLICAEVARAAWTAAVSERFGHVKTTLERKGQRIEEFDAAIAAHALAEGAALVTANVADMKRVPGLTIDDWAAR
jgi:tRNA(fMet)-specific endonuclease VapC